MMAVGHGRRTHAGHVHVWELRLHLQKHQKITKTQAKSPACETLPQTKRSTYRSTYRVLVCVVDMPPYRIQLTAPL